MTIHCSKCGQGIMAPKGQSQLDYLRELIRIGWTIAPIALCRTCACPMDYHEMANSKNLRLLKDSSSLIIFRAHMNMKYGRNKVDAWFRTL